MRCYSCGALPCDTPFPERRTNPRLCLDCLTGEWRAFLTICQRLATRRAEIAGWRLQGKRQQADLIVYLSGRATA